MTQLKKYIFILFVFLFQYSLQAKETPFLNDSVNKKAFYMVSGINAGLWIGTISALNYVWYKDFPKSKFHHFDDSHEWQQMDKFGHSTIGWLFARTTSDLYKLTGLDSKKSALMGSLISYGYMATFECLDGFSKEWGFSSSDILANTIGIGLFYSQALIWDEQKVKIKFSSHQSGLAIKRPNLLGNSFSTRLLKDYNGQTYWLSTSPFNYSTKKHPLSWLAISIGHGINHQLYGNGDIYFEANSNGSASFIPYRQLFLSLDIDFENIQTDKKWLKTAFRVLNFVKIPLPTLELSQGQFKGHLIYH